MFDSTLNSLHFFIVIHCCGWELLFRPFSRFCRREFTSKCVNKKDFKNKAESKEVANKYVCIDKEKKGESNGSGNDDEVALKST